MALLWAVWVLMTGPLFVTGYRLLSLTAPAERIAALGDRDFVAVWLGMLAVSNILLLAATISPLTPVVALLVALVAGGVGLGHRATRARLVELAAAAHRARPAAVLATAAVSLAIAFLTALPVYLYDTGLYHYPHIKWLAAYGEVRGLALLHDRFGLVSSWFTLPAAFDHGLLAGRMASAANGFALAIAAGQIVASLCRWRAGAADRFFATAAGLAVVYALATGFVNSASPDLPLFFLPAIIVRLALGAPDRRLPPVVLLLALLMVTIKPSALPVTVVAALFVLWPPSTVSLVGWGFAGAAVMLPTVLADLSTSGCALFPAAATCFDVPWSPGAEVIRHFTSTVTGWTRWGGNAAPHADLGHWWAQWAAQKSKMALLLLIGLSAAAGLGLRRIMAADRRIAFAVALAAAGIVYVVALAPDLRFAIGYLVLLPALFFAYRQQPFGTPSPRAAVVGLLSALCAACVMDVGKSRSIPTRDAGPRTSILAMLVSPAQLPWLRGASGSDGAPDPASYVEETTEGFAYRRPAAGDQCWDIPLPCAPEHLSRGITLRRPDEGLAGGFVRP